MKRLLKRIVGFLVVALAVMMAGFVASDPASARGGRGGGRGGRGGRGGGRGGRTGGRFGGRGRGSGTGGVTDRRQVAQDLEDRRLQEEKEERIRESRRIGAEEAYDEMQERVLDGEREAMSEDRRLEWRPRANPA
jgi:hypothetical protein